MKILPDIQPQMKKTVYRNTSHHQCVMALRLHAVSQLHMLVQHRSAAKHLLTLSTEPIDAHIEASYIDAVTLWMYTVIFFVCGPLQWWAEEQHSNCWKEICVQEPKCRKLTGSESLELTWLCVCLWCDVSDWKWWWTSSHTCYTETSSKSAQHDNKKSNHIQPQRSWCVKIKNNVKNNSTDTDNLRMLINYILHFQMRTWQRLLSCDRTVDWPSHVVQPCGWCSLRGLGTGRGTAHTSSLRASSFSPFSHAVSAHPSSPLLRSSPRPTGNVGRRQLDMKTTPVWVQEVCGSRGKKNWSHCKRLWNISTDVGHCRNNSWL